MPDLDEAVLFFVEVLGAKEVFRIAPISDPHGESMTRKVGVHPRATVRGVMLRFGPAANVEFLQYDVPGQATAPPKALTSGRPVLPCSWRIWTPRPSGCDPSPG